jgi:hypothetical protein
MHHWTKCAFVAAAALLLTGCLWGPGKFNSDLTLRKDGSFVLNYRGEVILQTPTEADKAEPWNAQSMARCHASGKVEVFPDIQGGTGEDEEDAVRACTAAELAKAKAQYERGATERAAAKQKENEEMAKAFGIPGMDEASNRAFAAKLMKYEGWRSVTYRGKGVFDVDYHFEGRATQDYVFPMMPDSDMLIPFVAIRRRSDGTVLVAAPAMTGKTGPIGARVGAAAADAMKGGPVSRAEGRLTVITDGEILTNNSEDGTAAHPLGRQVHWDVGPGSTKIPETLIRLR